MIEIRSLKVAGKVTLKHIADELGVSAMTVSRALNNSGSVQGKTQERILETARQMGYRPNHIAKSLVSRRTYTLGVVIPEISHSFFPEVIRGIEEVVYDKGYQIILAHSSEDAVREQEVVEMLLSKRVDGIMISCSQNTEDASFFENIAKTDTRIVFFDRCIEDIGISCIGVNDRNAAYKITEHLINLGKRRIAHLKGSGKVSITKNRLLGFEEALHQNRVNTFSELIIESGFQEKGGYEAMKVLLDLPTHKRPDAVFAVNDPVAFGAMEAINEAGLRIPEDMALVGFSDDIRSPLMSVPLTTIHQPAYDMGTKAASKLIRLIENDKELQEKVMLISTLKVRESCGANQ